MNPYSRLIEMMEERGAVRNGFDMEAALVTNVSPLQIRIGETDIPFNIYCNPAFLAVPDPASVQTTETALKQCLTGLYNAFKIKVGDRVLVQHVRDNGKDKFYVICKVVEP